MRLPRVRFTIRRMLLVVGGLCLVLGLAEHVARRRQAATARLLLARQEIAVAAAEATYLNAKLTREVAEVAVAEYREGVSRAEIETARGEIALADSDRMRAEDRAGWASRMLQKGYVSGAQTHAELLGLKRAVFSEEEALTKMRALQKPTRETTIKGLQGEVERARAAEAAKKATLDRERAELARLKAEAGGP